MSRRIVLLAVADVIGVLLLIFGYVIGIAMMKMEVAKHQHDMRRGRELGEQLRRMEDRAFDKVRREAGL